MADGYKVVRCINCKSSVFPWETYPWGTCTKDRSIICQTVRRTCNTFERKESNGKNK